MAQKYFTGLNYTLGNEDTTLEVELIKKLNPKAIFSICGSGGRSLPLMHETCESLALSDLSKEQLLLARLRLATYKELSFDDFFIFWGYFPYSNDNYQTKRKEIFERLTLEEETRKFFESVFLVTQFDSLLYLGKWERTFALFAKINKIILGKDFDRIMRFDNLESQIHYYQNEFPMKRWKAVLHILGNKAMFNALLYKGDFIKKNSELSHFDYYFRAFNHLFTHDLAQKSFFLHLCFYGRIKSFMGVPVEASQESFNRVKKSKTVVEYVKEDFVSYLSKGEKTYDFLSLSDVPSYFQGTLEKEFMQKIRPSLKAGAIIVNRYYLRTSECDLTDFEDVTSAYDTLLQNEKVQMYNVKIYKYCPKY